MGILITTDRHLEDAIGLTRAAVSKGHEVVIFSMDAGTKLLALPEFTRLHELKGVKMSFCVHSAEHQKMGDAVIPEGIICGSQYNNAVMMHGADKVIRL